MTYDVDLVAQVVALHDYHRLEREFEKLGFARPDFADALTGMIVPDDALAERVHTVLRRLTLLAGAARP